MGSAPPASLPVTRWPCTRRFRCEWCIRASLTDSKLHRRAWQWIAEQRHKTWGYEP